MACSSSTIAARAQLFMRQCRSNTRTHNSIIKRTVSSSHLAPSNFGKPLRLRDEKTDDSPPSSSSTARDQERERERDWRHTQDQNPTLTSFLQQRDQSSLPRQQQLQLQQQQQLLQRRPIISTGPPIPGGFINFLKYRVLNLPVPRPTVKPPPFTVQNNPYRARKQWPPDFRTLHAKQQFHFEKTYRRRLVVKAKSQRYNWNRYVKLLQQSLILLSVIYFIFIADPYQKEGGGTPLDGFRAWFFGQFSKNEHIPEALREQAQELQAYYSKNWNREDEERDEVLLKARESNMASSQAVLEARGSKKAA